MNRTSRMEDLSTEIIFEIFDYFHALDVFVSFASLNTRISSILRSIRLRILILPCHCRRQIDILSKYLAFHADQVISIEIYDRIRDLSSVINFLFTRHNFVNLQACTFITHELEPHFRAGIIRQLESLTKLVSMRIIPELGFQRDEIDPGLLCETVLTCMSPTLRSISFIQDFNPSEILSSAMATSNLTTLELSFLDSSHAVSLSSVLLVLRIYRLLRRLSVIINYESSWNNIPTVSSTKSWENDNLPISPHLICFCLYTQDLNDRDSLNRILYCMPNLRRFIFDNIGNEILSPNVIWLLNGHVWQELLSNNLVHLNRFDFLLHFDTHDLPIDLDSIVNSFKHFVTQYDNWHLFADRWQSHPNSPSEHVRLQTANYQSKWNNSKTMVPNILCRIFETRSTIIANDSGATHSQDTALRLNIEMGIRMPDILLLSPPPFQHVKKLIIHLEPSATTSFWTCLLRLNFMHRDDDNNDPRQCVANLSRLVQLSNITEVKFRSKNLSWLPAIEQILLVCSNLTNLVIGTPLLLSPMFLDNASLIPMFNRLETLVSELFDVYFPLNCASKLVQRFPSLVNIELTVYSRDDCIQLLDIFLDGFAKLNYLNLNCRKGEFSHNVCSLHYVIQKRRQTFGIDLSDKNNVTVKIGKRALEIWLA